MATRAAESNNIVIIGGGYAGTAVYLELAKRKFKNPDTRIILISQTNFLYHNVAAPRALVQQGLASQICIPLDRLVNAEKSAFVHGKIVTDLLLGLGDSLFLRLSFSCFLRLL